jgi:hypothetical protein
MIRMPGRFTEEIEERTKSEQEGLWLRNTSFEHNWPSPKIRDMTMISVENYLTPATPLLDTVRVVLGMSPHR